MLELLEHPLVLLIAGALLTNYLLPRITRRWQDRQKEIELKTDFVAGVSDAVLDMLTAVQYAEVGAQTQTAEDYDAAYRAWEKERARIAARLRGYFPESGLIERWSRLGEAVTAVYALSGTSDSSYRDQRIGELQTLLPRAAVDWRTLASFELKTGAGAASIQDRAARIHGYRGAWFDLREAVLDELGELVEEMLDAPLAWLEPRRRRRSPSGKAAAVAPAPANDGRAAGGAPPRPTATAGAPPVASENAVRYDVFGAIAPPDRDRLDESDPESLRLYAVKWFNYGRPQEALEPLGRAIELAPEDARLHHLRSMAHKELGNHEAALADSREALRLEPRNGGFWLGLHEVHRAAGRPAEALEAADEAIATDPDYRPYWLARAEALDLLGRTEEADAAYEKSGMTRQPPEDSES